MSEVLSFATQTESDNYLPAMNLGEGSCLCLISKNIVHITATKKHVSVYISNIMNGAGGTARLTAKLAPAHP